jgi:hypothetical protein
MENKKVINQIFIKALGNVTGIRQVVSIAEKDRHQIQQLEEEAEKRSLMGLGKVINTGVYKVLKGDLVFVALTTMEFDWTERSSLILKKGDQLVGEEVRNENQIAKLKQDRNVWFMHRNFVIYKDKVSFPKDIMQKVCYFEITCLPADWCIIDEKDAHCSDIYYGSPSSLSDVFLKENYFNNTQEKGLGTILIGAQLIN